MNWHKSKLIIILMLLNSLICFAENGTDPELALINEYRRLIGERPTEFEDKNNATSKVITDYSVFLSRLKNFLGDSKFSVLPVAGFSGAGYERPSDLDRIFEVVLNQLNDNYNRIHQSDLEKEKLVVILGGSNDGIGRFYDLIMKKVKESKLYQDVIVVGIVKSKVIEYEIEGRAKGWSTLSPHQNLLLLQKTKSPGWEVITDRETSANIDIVIDLGNMDKCERINYSLFEGGPVALRESLELAVRTYELVDPKKLWMELFPTYSPNEKKVAAGKDNGYRAATQTALALYALKLNWDQKIIVGVVNPHGMVSFFLANMGEMYQGKELLKKVEEITDPQTLEELRKDLGKLAISDGKPMNSPEYNIIKAKIDLGENLKATTDILGEVLIRLLPRLDELRNRLDKGTNNGTDLTERRENLNKMISIANQKIETNRQKSCFHLFL